MALTLRDSMAPALQLRDQPSIVDQGLAFEQYQADDSNPVLRGWRSAGLGSEANSLFSEANAAERRGDMLAAQAYEQQAQDSLRRSQVWAPTTQEFTKIDGLRSAGSWLGGQIGNLRTSVPPLVGGVVGGLGGAALGGLAAGPGGAALGGRIGAGLGAGAMGYGMEYDESVGNAMMDPQIRATRSADDIHNASMVKGVVAGALESVVPAGVAKAALLGVGKKVAAESLKKGMVKAAAIDAAQEAMTEAAQELTGQSTQNYLRGEDLTNWDAEQAFNAAMGGAVGGAVMGAGGQAAGTARDYLANREPKEKRDLLGRGIDAFIKHSEKTSIKRAQREIAATEGDEATFNKLFGKRTPHITDPISDEESKLSDEEIGKSRRALAEQHALEVVKAPAGMYPAEEVQAANEFLTGQAKDWMKMRDVSRTSRADKKAQDDAAALMKAAGLKEEKNSLMSPTLTDDFGEQEGRSMDDDIVTDDQGNVVRRANTRDMALPNDERGFGSTLRRVTSLQKSWDKQATEEQAKRTVTLADVLVNGGYWPKDIVDAAKTATQKEAQLTSAATLLTWLKYGMMRERKVKGGDTENVIEHLVGRYGKSGVDMLNKAYEVGVNAGLFDRNDEMFAERRVEAEKLLADEKNLGDLIMANLSPELKREVRTKEDVAYLVRKVRRMAGTVGAQANPEHNAKLRDATDTASPSRVDQRVLEEMFPNAENRHKVLAAAYSPSNSAFGAESKASQPVKETDGTGRTAKSFEVDERSSMEAEENEDDTAPSTTQKVEYLNRKKGHAYSKKDPEHRAQLAKDRKEAQADGYRVEEIGAVERALEVARRSKGEALSEQEKFSVIEKEVKKHTRKGLDRPTEPPANASDVAKRLYADEMKRYKQRVQRAARGVDNRFVYLKRTETTDAPMSTELDLEAILSNERDVKIDDPRNGIGNGTMWFKKKTGGTFIINAPQITRLMFQRTENDGGLNHTVGTGEEKRELTKGGPQNVLELFHEGVASILAHDLFSGEFGYVHGGKAVEVAGNAKFPAEFKLSKSVTYGQGVASQKSFADQIEGNEFDTEEMSQPTHRMQATMWQKFLALKAFAKKGENVSPEMLTRLNKFVANVQANIDDNRKKGAKGDDLISRRNHIFLGKWMGALGIEAGAINVAEAGVEKSRAKDGLQAYDPEKAIVRGKNGMAETGDNIEMAAASLIGRSKRGTGPVAERKVGEKIVDTPIVERVEDQGGVPTAKTPDRAEDGVAATQREAGRQVFVDALRTSMGDFRKVVANMSNKEIGMFQQAFKEFVQQSSDFPHTIAKGYFGGNVDKARMFVARLKKNSVEIDAIIAARRGELKNVEGRAEQDSTGAFGEGRQADAGRTEARVAARDNGQRPAAPSELRTGDAQRPASRATGGRGLLDKLKSAKPKNEFHRRAIKKVVAILEGGEGKLVDALNTMMRWDQSLGDLSPRQREALKSAVEARGEKFEDVPIEAYNDDELGYDPEQAEFDRAEFEAEASKDSKKAAKGNASTLEEQAAVAEQLHKLLGKDVKILFENLGGKSGSWTREQTMNVIRIAINADITSTGFHESMHQLLYLLKQGTGDGAKVVEQLQRAAMSPIMQQRLRTMLKDHPKAMSQLTDPEEAVSYMFQFWMMDQSGFKIGPETRTLFERFKDFLRSIAALFSKTIRTQLLTEQASRIEAKTTLRVLNDLAAGKMADPTQRPSAIKVMAEYTGKRDEAVKNLGEGYKQLLQGFGKYLATNEGLLESYNNRHLTRLARLFNQRAGEAKREGASFFDERDFRINKMMNKWEKVAQKYSKEDLEIARAWMSTEQGQAHPDAGINAIVTDVKGILNEMKAYIAERDIKRLEPNPVTGKMEWKSIDFRKHYWPRIWDAELVNANKEEILEKLLGYTEVENIAKAATKEALKQGKPEVTKEDVALQIFSRMLGGTSQVELSEELSDLGMTPVATAVNRRSLEWLNMREFDKYVSKDMNNIMSAYIRNIIKRGEYQHRFGPGGEFLKELVDSAILTELGGEKLLDLAVSSLEMAQKNWGQAKAAAEQAGKKFNKEYPTTRSVGLAIYRSQHGDKAAEKIDATMKRLEPAFQAIMALEGTLGSDIDPTLRNVSSWVTTYQNYRLLVPGIFSSFMDVMGVVREGGELSDAWGAFVAGIKEIRNTWTNEKGRDYMMERAELFGSADAGSYASTIGEANGSVYMSEGARKWSDRLFKWNGMEGWNRGMRAYATSVAERILLDWQKNGIDTKDKAAVARVERLFGKGFDVKNIAVEADGTLDIKDARNIAAVNRWVLDAVIRPNAAHRPVMASDPHMQVFYHLKNFTYSMHAVMLKNVAAQARLGNYRPAMVTLVGYAPIAIAAGAVKELLIPGDEPPWLKNGLVGYLGYGWDRAGVLGIPQMYASNLFDPAQNFGPSAGQLQDLITVPFGEFQVGPAGWRDHRVFEEMLGAAPFGTVLKRIGKNVDDIIEGK